jgi:hypothetical protein
MIMASKKDSKIDNARSEPAPVGNKREKKEEKHQ